MLYSDNFKKMRKTNLVAVSSQYFNVGSLFVACEWVSASLIYLLFKNETFLLATKSHQKDHESKNVG